jgi:hypothetical protein
MQRMIFKNIYCRLTFKNLSPCLASFWSWEVLDSNESKVWIILAVKSRDGSFNIIEPQAFCTKDYIYIHNLLRNNIYYSSVSREYIIKDLVFYFKFGSET